MPEKPIPRSSRTSSSALSRLVLRMFPPQARYTPLSQKLISFWALLFITLSSVLAAESPAIRTNSNLALVQDIYKAGMDLVQRGLLDEAIQTFERGLNREPTHLVLLNAIGATYSLKGNKEEAQRHFLRALELDPQFEPARKNLAIAYFDSGQYDLAIPEFEHLSEKPEGKPVAFLFLGMISENRRQYQKAIEYLEQSGNLAFQYPRALLSFAQSLYKSGQPEKSQLVLERLQATSNVSASDWLQAGVFYARLGEYQKALEVLNKVKQKDSQLPALDSPQTYVLDRLGRSKEGLKILQGLTDRDPDARTLNLLAHVAERAGEIDLSIQAFRKAAKLEPAREENYLDYSTLCMNHKNFPLALEIVEVGLGNLPRSYRLLVQKGAILAELGKLDQAHETLRSAMELEADHREALLSLARIQAHAGEFDDVVETIAAGVEKYPDDFYMHYYCGFVLLERTKRQGMEGEMLERAQRVLERAIHLNPTFAGSYLLLGKIYLDKDPKVAAGHLETCLRLDPNNASAKYQLGRLYLKMGKHKEGESLLSQVKGQRSQQAEEDKKPRIGLVRE
jgi:tetratricopeptide (TPR) repeat protein